MYTHVCVRMRVCKRENYVHTHVCMCVHMYVHTKSRFILENAAPFGTCKINCTRPRERCRAADHKPCTATAVKHSKCRVVVICGGDP